MKLAVCQLRCDASDDEGRGAALEVAVRRAAVDGAELVVLPEMAACGYLLDADHLDRHAEPGDGSGAVLGRWRELAGDLGVAIIGGFAERTGSGVANAAVVIDRAERSWAPTASSTCSALSTGCSSPATAASRCSRSTA